MASEVRSSVARSDRYDPIIAQLRHNGTVRLRCSKPLIDLLEELSNRLNTPVADLLTQAVGLFKVAVDAQARGEQICLVDDEDDIVGEITDFGATVGLSIAQFPEEDADREER